jgi:hypothetical protein
MTKKNVDKVEIYFKVNERILGQSRPETRPKSTTIITALQNRTILDIRAIQPPVQPPVIELISIDFYCVV